MSASENAHVQLQVAAAAADDMKGEDLVALDVSGPLPFSDVFLLVTGHSERHVSGIARDVEEKMLEAGFKTLRREGRTEGRWVLLDYGDLVVNVFHEEDRLFYSLERLWKDCPSIPIELEAPVGAEG
ncbi:ribosome silencing factor [Homoserinimonas sp. OAct 916]|uniref:ribosome silencing factor n=1 Tax=Homoserinimonas sp. OAct 916 TaxID=2211450 RepID=UPI000DBE5ADD|nr:ribosome silencing factor [Homoserinimonas sp. OAct 916]